jgi:hypothetical protein
MLEKGPSESAGDDERAGEQQAGGRLGVFPIELAGTLPVSDYIHARRLAVRSFWPRVYLVILGVVAFCAFFTAIAISVWPYCQGASLRIFMAVLVVFPLIVLGPVLWFRFQEI